MNKWKKFDLMDNPEKVKEFLKRDAIIYTEFEKRCEAISAYFRNERFGLYEMLREFIVRVDDACMIERIVKLSLLQQERESFKAREPQVYSISEEIDANTSNFEKYFNINYAPLDMLASTGEDKHRHIFQWAEEFFKDAEPIGDAKKEYSIEVATKAMDYFCEGAKHFTGSYLNLPIITPRGRMGTSNKTALVQIDFSKPDQEIKDYLLTIKRELQNNPLQIQDLDHFLDQRLLPQQCQTAEEIWKALRSHENNGGKDLATRWADMLFIYDCEEYLTGDEVYTYIKAEIDRYWHQKNPQINFESYGNAYFFAELKNMLYTDFQKESDEIKAKYTSNDGVDWAKYGLSKMNKVKEIQSMILSDWNQESEENRYPHYAGKIQRETYKNNQTLIKAMIDEGKITKFMFGVDLSRRTKYISSIPPQTYQH
jgi:hypothetical protein